ncbi:MAG: 5-formyltetrahydrofolate cyclo-ligase, partial [Neisseriaceae bacterium]|nr:5-formyltetrahydrofolate cyclo-ligase [Neisseriaceae bacterium]
HLFKHIKKSCQKVAVYEHMGSEVSLQPFIQQVSKYYPKIKLYKPFYYHFNKRMWFIPLNSHQLSAQKLRIEQLDIILTPMLGVDKHGYRLGQGGGYYDASLKHALLRTYPQKIAIGFDCQLVKKIPHEKHDIRMNTFISEKRILQFKK